MSLRGGFSHCGNPMNVRHCEAASAAVAIQ